MTDPPEPDANEPTSRDYVQDFEDRERWNDDDNDRYGDDE